MKTPVEQNDGKDKWYTIGAAWVNKDRDDKEYISAIVDLPVQNGRIILVKE